MTDFWMRCVMKAVACKRRCIVFIVDDGLTVVAATVDVVYINIKSFYFRLGNGQINVSIFVRKKKLYAFRSIINGYAILMTCYYRLHCIFFSFSFDCYSILFTLSFFSLLVQCFDVFENHFNFDHYERYMRNMPFISLCLTNQIINSWYKFIRL